MYEASGILLPTNEQMGMLEFDPLLKHAIASRPSRLDTLPRRGIDKFALDRLFAVALAGKSRQVRALIRRKQSNVNDVATNLDQFPEHLIDAVAKLRRGEVRLQSIDTRRCCHTVPVLASPATPFCTLCDARYVFGHLARDRSDCRRGARDSHKRRSEHQSVYIPNDALVPMGREQGNGASPLRIQNGGQRKLGGAAIYGHGESTRSPSTEAEIGRLPRPGLESVPQPEYPFYPPLAGEMI